MKLPLHIFRADWIYLADANGVFVAKSIGGELHKATILLEAVRDAANLSTELPAVQVNAKLFRACELALEVIRRHDAGVIYPLKGQKDGLPVHEVTFPLDHYCGEDNLVDSSGVQGIGDVLREAIAAAKSA